MGGLEDADAEQTLYFMYADILLVNVEKSHLSTSLSTYMSKRDNALRQKQAENITVLFWRTSLPGPSERIPYYHYVQYQWTLSRAKSVTDDSEAAKMHAITAAPNPIGAAAAAINVSAGATASGDHMDATRRTLAERCLDPVQHASPNMDSTKPLHGLESLKSLLLEFVSVIRKQPLRWSLIREAELLRMLADAVKVADRNERIKRLDGVASAIKNDKTLNTQQWLQNLLHAYRDVKAWKKMIDLVKEVSPRGFKELRIDLRVLIAFAYNRDGRVNDALKLCNDLIVQLRPGELSQIADPTHRHELKEVYGIKGRIYKDKYLEHLHLHRTSQREPAAPDNDCSEAIEAYRQVYKLERRLEGSEKSLYGAVNLMTLLFCASQHEEARGLCEEINSATEAKASSADLINRGSVGDCVPELSDYWDVANVCEANAVLGYILAGSMEAGKAFKTANIAARRMQELSSFSWMLETTHNNLSLIQKVANIAPVRCNGLSLLEIVNIKREGMCKREVVFVCVCVSFWRVINILIILHYTYVIVYM